MTITIDNEKEFNWLAADLIDNHVSFISGVADGKFEIVRRDWLTDKVITRRIGYRGFDG